MKGRDDSKDTEEKGAVKLKMRYGKEEKGNEWMKREVG